MNIVEFTYSQGNVYFFSNVKNEYFLNKHCVVISGEHIATSNKGDF